MALALFAPTHNPCRTQLEPALRERCFGGHELTSCSNYELVWAEDAKSTANRCVECGANEEGSRAALMQAAAAACSQAWGPPQRFAPHVAPPRPACRRPPGEGGESVEDVAARTAGLVERLEARHSGRHVVLVSHGDALSILAAALLGTGLGGHRRHGLPNCGILRIG